MVFDSLCGLSAIIYVSCGPIGLIYRSTEVDASNDVGANFLWCEARDCF